MDKVSFAVDDFLDSQNPSEFLELAKGEDYLLHRVQNFAFVEQKNIEN